jgi:isoamylase
MNTVVLEPSRSSAFGAHVFDDGVNFAIWSDNADAIDLCVFENGVETRYPLHNIGTDVFSGFLSGAKSGLVYGYRARANNLHDSGQCFNPNKLLLDPYAREIVGTHVWDAKHWPNNNDDNAAIAIKARVAPPLPRIDRPPLHRDDRVVLYETHVKGFSKLNPRVPESIRGTYAGLAHDASIVHLKKLGVTTVSLLPVHYHLDEQFLVGRGMTNYWGYNTIGFFAPDPALSSTPGDPTATMHEFRAMVDTLHVNGLEVVIDVVYNHTPEGNEQGACLSFRGLDQPSWYRMNPHARHQCENFTGCGNTLNVHHPRVTQFVLDSLRYWVETMGVDGFRFDLAPVLGRTPHGFDRNAPFFIALAQDPVLSTVRLIAEPWDIGPHGYQVGHFPAGFWDWNDKFRDSVRRYWLDAPHGEHTTRGEIAQRLTASSQLFRHHPHRLPAASVNYISVHDGFCLADMVSYGEKINHANGEDNRDGRDGEPSSCFGVEGVSQDFTVNEARARARRALLATLAFAQGTPMLRGGDEIGHTQRGNNNPYCQDNEITWHDWENADDELTRFVSKVFEIRANEPLLRWPRWFGHHDHSPKLRWLNAQGYELHEQAWHAKDDLAFSLTIDAGDHAVLLCLNPTSRDVEFHVPRVVAHNTHAQRSEHAQWQLLLDSSLVLSVGFAFDTNVSVSARSVVLARNQTIPSPLEGEGAR